MAADSDDASKPNEQLGCLLLSMPAEIRNKIWVKAVSFRDVADNATLLVVHRSKPRDAEPLTEFGEEEASVIAVQPALTRTSRQIRAEALTMFYANNTFCIRYSKYDLKAPDQAARWLRSLGQNARHIQTLHFEHFNASFDDIWSLLTTRACFGVNINGAGTAKLLGFSTSATVKISGWGGAVFSDEEAESEKFIEGRMQTLARGLARRYECKGKKAFSAGDWVSVFQCVDRLFGIEGRYGEYK